MASLRRPSVYMPSPAKVTLPPTQPPRREESSKNEHKSGKLNTRKSKVGDAIKKRLSMRYAGGDEVMAEPPPLPGQPSAFLAPGFTASRTSAGFDGDEDDDAGVSRFHQFASPEFAQGGFEATDVQDEQIRRRGAADMTREEEWDLEELGKEGFDLNDYMRRTLTGADGEEVKRFKAALMRQKGRNASDMQRNVFKHYAEFVTISKEISTLENDMLELKELLGQWKDLPQLMGMEDTLAPRLDKEGNLERRRTQRNSVADLQTLYKQQLSHLWSTVEGSQKFLPLVPGRHLMFETHEYVELNAATYKAKQSVSIFLLNDLLLIAGRRRTKAAHGDGGERGRMVAERCWVLADLVVVDVKDSGDLTNAIKIRRGKDVCVYRTSRPEDKKALLSAFRQVSQELGEKKRKETEKEQVRRKTLWLGDVRQGGLAGVPASGRTSTGRPLSMIGTSIADSKDTRWIDEFGDDLTMTIAMRDWDQALNLYEKGQDLQKTVASNASARDLLASRMDQLEPELVQHITHDLTSLELRKTTACRLIGNLIRLDRPDLARDTFLGARREIMLKRVRGIRAEGDVSIYISELAIVCFTIIRHTSDWYMSAFKENTMASGFVTWAKVQVETFADMFRRQVYAPAIPADVVDECIKVAASHNRKLLRDVGLDFTFLLSTLLQPDPTATQPHPIFASSSTAQTPGVGYHIEPSPYPSYFAETPAPDQMDVVAGSTAPLALKGRRRPSEGVRAVASREGTPRSNTPDQSRPPAPPKSARRVDSNHSTRAPDESMR